MSDNNKQRKFLPARFWFVALTALIVAACVTTPPPVQEMSDARQAVEAARQAGAEQYAPQLFERSVTLLESAQTTLRRRLYTQAKNQALGARRLAIEALEEATRQSNRSQ